MEFLNIICRRSRATPRRWARAAGAGALAVAAATVVAAPPASLAAAAAPRGAAPAAAALPEGWDLSADGAQVVDPVAQLAWARCVEGMRWTGRTCVGEPLLLDRAAAAAHAAERATAENQPWRLPRVPELQRLVDRSLSPPGPHAALFPAAPVAWHWSSTSNTGGRRGNLYNYSTVMEGQQGSGSAQMRAINGWAVNLSSGQARGDAARGSRLPVRLVRSIAVLPPAQ